MLRCTGCVCIVIETASFDDIYKKIKKISGIKDIKVSQVLEDSDFKGKWKFLALTTNSKYLDKISSSINNCKDIPWFIKDQPPVLQITGSAKRLPPNPSQKSVPNFPPPHINHTSPHSLTRFLYLLIAPRIRGSRLCTLLDHLFHHHLAVQ